MITLRIESSVPAVIGLVWATARDGWVYPPGFEERLEGILNRRVDDLSSEEDAVRTSARDMLRNGKYKPTGRGKPASEYLVRAAREQAFPRINPVVDVCNLVSLESLCPISLWDVDKAGTDRFCVRHGRDGESYIFNHAGQEIEVADLIVGCRVTDDEAGEPIVNPVKDRLLTKTDDGTRRVAAVVYGPPSLRRDVVARIAEGFAELLGRCGHDIESGWSVVEPGERFG